MRPGDAVIVTDMDGSRFRFVAAEIHTLSPDQVREMTESEWDLTLFTCTADGSLRFAVCCISENES
jgi:sortase A